MKRGDTKFKRSKETEKKRIHECLYNFPVGGPFYIYQKYKDKIIDTKRGNN